jgi:hypothetical protein
MRRKNTTLAQPWVIELHLHVVFSLLNSRLGALNNRGSFSFCLYWLEPDELGTVVSPPWGAWKDELVRSVWKRTRVVMDIRDQRGLRGSRGNYGSLNGVICPKLV